jgi:hypothetical protein
MEQTSVDGNAVRIIEGEGRNMRSKHMVGVACLFCLSSSVGQAWDKQSYIVSNELEKQFCRREASVSISGSLYLVIFVNAKIR